MRWLHDDQRRGLRLQNSTFRESDAKILSVEVALLQVDEQENRRNIMIHFRRGGLMRINELHSAPIVAYFPTPWITWLEHSLLILQR